MGWMNMHPSCRDRGPFRISIRRVMSTVVAALVLALVGLPLVVATTAQPASAQARTFAYIADNGGRIIRVDLTSGAQTVIASGPPLVAPTDILLTSDGTLFITDELCCAGGVGGVIRINPANGAQSILSQDGNFVDL